jgi:hypothetical protein
MLLQDQASSAVDMLSMMTSSTAAVSDTTETESTIATERRHARSSVDSTKEPNPHRVSFSSIPPSGQPQKQLSRASIDDKDYENQDEPQTARSRTRRSTYNFCNNYELASDYNLNDFNMLKVLGRGGFGKVFFLTSIIYFDEISSSDWPSIINLNFFYSS